MFNLYLEGKGFVFMNIFVARTTYNRENPRPFKCNTEPLNAEFTNPRN
jgi:hypothetical protein